MYKKCMIIVLLVLICMPSIANAYTQVYDEKNNVLYYGSFWLNHIARQKGNKEYSNYKNKIYKLNLKTGERSKLNILISAKSNDSDVSFFSPKIYSFGLSPSGLLSVTIFKREPEIMGLLQIYSPDMKLLREFKKVPANVDKVHYDWSNDGNMLAFVKGRAGEAYYGDFGLLGTYLYDVSKDKVIKIDELGTKVSWTDFDNNLYITRDFETEHLGMIDTYDPKTATLKEKTGKKGIVFSPDGKHYIGKEMAGNFRYGTDYFRYSIYNGTSNDMIYPFEEKESSWKNFRFIDNTHALNWTSRGDYRVYDITTKKVIRSSDKAPMLGWNEDLSKLVVYNAKTDKINIIETISGKLVKEVDLPK